MAVAAIAITNLSAVTRVPSADGRSDIRTPAVGAGQRRHRHRRPRQSVQRLWLPEGAGCRDNTLLRQPILRVFGLHHDGAGRFDSITRSSPTAS